MPRKPPPTSRRPDDPPPDPARTANDILTRAKNAGFALAGIAPAQPSLYQQQFRDWLTSGKHGDMDYLTEDLGTRLDPTRILEGTKSFIVVADMYAGRAIARSGAVGGSFLNTESAEKAQRAQSGDGAEEKDGDSLAPSFSSPSAFLVLSVFKSDTPQSHDLYQGRVARYAQGRNYHDVMKRRLHKLADQLRIDYPGSAFRTCVDTAPVNERELASLAAQGWQAKNTLIINPKLGSYMLLGVVATTLDLTPNSPRVPDSCGTCTRCIDACPTQAITPYSVDARRCISYLTIEHRGPIDPQHFAGMGNWIFGCDICQEVCPHNSPRNYTGDAGREASRRSPGSNTSNAANHTINTRHQAPHNAYAPMHTHFDLLQMLGWSEQDRRRAFTNSPMKRATLAMMKRNALIALGNTVRELESQQRNHPSPNAGAAGGEALRRSSGSNDSTALLRSRITQAASDPSEPELVRQTAAAVLHWLDQDQPTPLR